MPSQKELISELRRDLLDLTLMTEGVGSEWTDRQGRTHTLFSLAHDALSLAQQIFDDTHPTIVTLCGSTRFSAAFREARLRETLAGNIVLTLGSDSQNDEELHLNSGQIEMLNELHFHKIDMSDEVFIVNSGGYIGEHTQREIDYAQRHGKVIRYLVNP